MALSDHIETLYDLRRDRSAGYEKPYKPALLLTLIDLIEQGDVLDNRFTLTPKLIELNGRSVLLPKEKKFYPADEAIAWRVERLLVAG